MKFMCTAAVAALVALGAGVGPADAAVMVSKIGNSIQGGDNKAGIDFAVGYGAHTPGGASWGGAAPVVIDNLSGQYQSPFNSNGLTAITSYFSANPTQTLSFDTDQSSFTMLWGSIDSYNTITFLLDGVAVGSKTGTDIVNQFDLGGSPANYEKVGLFAFSLDQGMFDAVRFDSTQAAFEFALAPAPVPLPAAGLMLLAAVAGLGAAARKRKA